MVVKSKEHTRVEDVERTRPGQFRDRNPSYALDERLMVAGDTTAVVFWRADEQEKTLTKRDSYIIM